MLSAREAAARCMSALHGTAYLRISHDVAAIGRAAAAVYGDTSARAASAEATGRARAAKLPTDRRSAGPCGCQTMLYALGEAPTGEHRKVGLGDLASQSGPGSVRTATRGAGSGSGVFLRPLCTMVDFRLATRDAA